MRTKNSLITFTDTTPAAASTVKGTAIALPNAWHWDALTIDAFLVGATGGTLDVYLQRQITTDVWADWIHFAQLTAGGAAVHYALTVTGQATAIATVGGGTDASPSVALSAASYTNVLPGGSIRAVYVAGASTSAGAAVTIYFQPFSVHI